MKYGEIEFKGQNIYQHWEINDPFCNYSCGPSKAVQLISITKALLRDELGLHWKVPRFFSSRSYSEAADRGVCESSDVAEGEERPSPLKTARRCVLRETPSIGCRPAPSWCWHSRRTFQTLYFLFVFRICAFPQRGWLLMSAVIRSQSLAWVGCSHLRVINRWPRTHDLSNVYVVSIPKGMCQISWWWSI